MGFFSVALPAVMWATWTLWYVARAAGACWEARAASKVAATTDSAAVFSSLGWPKRYRELDPGDQGGAAGLANFMKGAVVLDVLAEETSTAEVELIAAVDRGAKEHHGHSRT
jgi:hypothetical protein